ncbi:MAG: adenylate/guanylate cyclase domain-containing protein [Paracoccaceae bacterium]
MIKDAPFEKVKLGAELWRVSKAVLFADVVDSVRLVDTDEEDAIRRWVSFADEAQRQIEASAKGRLVKRLGDGLLAEFDDVKSAARAALKLQAIVTKLNRKVPTNRRIELRMSLVAGEILHSADNDMYGHLVNVAQRLAAAARPGQILTSARVRDEIASDAETDCEDIGLLHLKNVSKPVQAYLLRDHESVPAIIPRASTVELLPTLAVLPIATLNLSEHSIVWSNLLTDDLISALSRSPEMNVISSLSTSSYRTKPESLSDIRSALAADFVISGNCREQGGKIVLVLEMAETLTGLVIWSTRMEFSAFEILQKNGIFSSLANEIHGALLKRELHRALSEPLPTLEGYAVLFGAQALMNRLSSREFNYAGELLDALIERIPHAPVPLAWKARWHVLKVQQGWTEDRMAEGLRALDYTQRALDIDPMNTEALVVAGNVNNNLLHDLDESEELFDSALEITPNDAMGRALRAVLYTFRSQGAEAVNDAERALQIAPLDPNRFFFQAMAAGAAISNDDNQRALELATSSLRLNAAHTSTMRIKAVAEWRMGEVEKAQKTMTKLMRKQPEFSIGWWQKNTPAAGYKVGEDFVQTLRDMDVPE